MGRGDERGAQSIQVFNQSPRMWRPTAYDEDDFAACREALRASRRVKAILIHAVYLLNCASTDKEIRDKTRASLIQSLRVGAGIGATGVVLHPGSAKQGHVGQAITRAGKVIGQALSETETCELHLEDTAGAGGTLGRSFSELAALLEAAGGGPRLAVCLDSCHLLASGYDVRTAEGLSDTLDAFEHEIGLERLHSLHLNDSQAPLGSNRDRHANVGEGELGESGCAVFLSEPRFETLPCVLETQGPERQGPSQSELELCLTLRRRGKAARARARGRAQQRASGA